MILSDNWKIHNLSGIKRILITRSLPGSEWIELLSEAGYRTEVWIASESLSREHLIDRMGDNCSGVIGQLTEKWDAVLFDALGKAGGVAYCNFAVGYDNVDLDSATRNGIAVGNTPGVLTEATAEMAVALTMSCSRRIREADEFTRNGKFTGWLPGLFLGKRLWKSTLGVAGAGRIGSAYARMMVRGFQMDLIYFDHKRNDRLEAEFEAFNAALAATDSAPVKITFTTSLEELLCDSDVVSLHVPLNAGTRHMIAKEQLQMMKPDAALINTSRGAVINEADLAEHCRNNPEFTAGLDVFEFEPAINDLLKELPNVTMAPHIASATRWTRENMAKLAALNIKGIIERYDIWEGGSIDPFLTDAPPAAIPSVLNKSVLYGR
jgi:glycerate dehydrogenase